MPQQPAIHFSGGPPGYCAFPGPCLGFSALRPIGNRFFPTHYLPLARTCPLYEEELRHAQVPVFDFLSSLRLPAPKWGLLSRESNLADRMAVLLGRNSESKNDEAILGWN